MPSHKWSSKVHSSSCSTCGVIRDAFRTDRAWSYRFPDGLGSVDTRPPCTRPTESRRTRKMGRRRKVLSRSRAGGTRLRSKEYTARLATAAVKLRITTAALPNAPGGEIFRAEVVDGVLHIIETKVIDSAVSFTVGEAKP